MCLLSDPASSPLTRVLQYFSALLDGSASRLRLLFLRAECTSWDDFGALMPDLAIASRYAIVVGASLGSPSHAWGGYDMAMEARAACQPNEARGGEAANC